MMRRGLLSLAGLALIAGSAPVLPAGDSIDQQVARAQVEARNAADRLAALERASANAEGEIAQLRARKAAAAAAIEDAEARISANDAEWRLAQTRLAAGQQALARDRAPIAALLAGLVTMGRQPPLLALADSGSPEKMVRIKALIDATLPIMRQRTAVLSAKLDAQKALVDRADAARRQLAQNRVLLRDRQAQFATLEAEASTRLAKLQGQAIGAGDRVLAGDEQLSGAMTDATAQRSAMALAAELARAPLAAPRPFRGDSSLPASTFAYRLPVSAPLSVGLGSIDDAGIMARGISFDTARGEQVVAPARGRILFSAPYRDHVGLIIIDHGEGRISMLLNVASDLTRGDTVEIGQPIGRATGKVELEFREMGQILSPAFIAASSPPLSNGAKTR